MKTNRYTGQPVYDLNEWLMPLVSLQERMQFARLGQEQWEANGKYQAGTKWAPQWPMWKTKRGG